MNDCNYSLPSLIDQELFHLHILGYTPSFTTGKKADVNPALSPFIRYTKRINHARGQYTNQLSFLYPAISYSSNRN